MAKGRVKVFRGPHFPFLDTRLGGERYANFAFAPPPVTTRAAWEKHAAAVRRRIWLAAGLIPIPPRTPLNARIFDRSDLEGCTIEKVHFESRPGVLVTGNLYRPTADSGERPAVLCPHGHWKNGRLEHGEHGSVPARCMMLARLGFVVFSYDMFGYLDSCQAGHRWPDRDCLRAMLYGLTTFGLQLWNSVRATDFVARLADVDAGRIGCTGASGGGTQTYYLAAVEPRIKAAAPVCMLSLHYQGGCKCEEPPLIHLGGLSTADVVGACAPRPILLPSVTGDWTNQNPRVEAPVLRKVYALYGAAGNVDNLHFDAGHNYGKAIREHVYAWFLRRLAGDRTVGRRVREPKLLMPTDAQARVFPGKKLPARCKRGRAFLADLMNRAATPFRTPPRSAGGLRRLRKTWSDVYAEGLCAREVTEAVSIGAYMHLRTTEAFVLSGRGLGRYGSGEQTPAVWAVPGGASANAPAALVVYGKGKQDLFTRGRPGRLLTALLASGMRVLAIDLLGRGEAGAFLEASQVERGNPVYYAFNRSLVAHRVQEILTSLAALRQHDRVQRPALIGLGRGAALALLARPLAGPLRCTAADLRGCAVADDRFWMGEMVHPLVRKIGDVRGALALGPVSPLLLAGAGAAANRWARAAYGLRQRGDSLRIATRAISPEGIAQWVAGAR